MDQITNNPGLQHITEDILLNLDFKKIQVCQSVNKNFKEILNDPIFWLKKWRLNGLSKENHTDWVKAIQLTKSKKLATNTKNKNLATNILLYIKKIIEVGHFVDVPCFTDKKVIEKFPMILDFSDILNGFMHHLSEDTRTGILQLLAATMNNDGKPSCFISSDIICRAINLGITNILKVLAPLKKYPNLLGITNASFGIPPIHAAIERGNVEMVKILAPLSKNPNSKDRDGQTAISRAAKLGILEIIEILAPLVNDPNDPDYDGRTPIFHASEFGHTEIIKLLAPYLLSV